MSRKTIQLPEDRHDDEPAEEFLPFAFIDLYGRDRGSDQWRAVAKDENGNTLYAPPSRYSIWSSWP